MRNNTSADAYESRLAQMSRRAEAPSSDTPDHEAGDAPGETMSTTNNTSATTFSQINADMLSAGRDGIEAGLTAGAVDLAVEGLVKTFPEEGLLAMAAQTSLGRTILSTAVPYFMAVICDFYPSIVPGDPKFMRSLAMSAFRGQMTLRVAPLVGRLRPVIHAFFKSLSGADIPNAAATDAASNG
jgi:hypothetical protein